MSAMKSSKRYAPLFIMAFSTGTALARKVGERVLLERKWRLDWNDVSTALIGAAVGYAIFRVRHGNETEGILTR